MLVLVLVVQVIATIIPATAIGSLSRSLNFDDVRSEEDDNAVVVEGRYWSLNISYVLYIWADIARDMLIYIVYDVLI